MSPLTPDDVIDLRDADLARELLPNVKHPFVHRELTADQCRQLSLAVFHRTQRNIVTVMDDIRSDQLILLFLECAREEGSLHGEETQWAEQNEVELEGKMISPWFFSHDGSREAAFVAGVERELQS